MKVLHFITQYMDALQIKADYIIGWVGVLGFSVVNLAEFNEVSKFIGSILAIIFIVLGIILRLIQIKKEKK